MPTPTTTNPDETGGARRRFRITRDGILFVTGLLGIIYETLISRGDNPSLLIIFGAMCGLPAFLKADERNKKVPPPETQPQEESAN